MSKSSKTPPDEWKAEGLRDMQGESMQGLLFSMVELGETTAFLQLEFDGVMHYLAARKVTQEEFDDVVRQLVTQKR